MTRITQTDDRIFLHGLSAECIIGFIDWERRVKQTVVLDIELPVRAVLTQLQAIEARCGRGRAAPRWAPRSMDLDVLLYGDLICDEPGLKLPRPDLLRRAYMLGPLAALAPRLLHPTAQLTIAELWARFDQAGHPLEPLQRSSLRT